MYSKLELLFQLVEVYRGDLEGILNPIQYACVLIRLDNHLIHIILKRSFYIG